MGGPCQSMSVHVTPWTVSTCWWCHDIGGLLISFSSICHGYQHSACLARIRLVCIVSYLVQPWLSFLTHFSFVGKEGKTSENIIVNGFIISFIRCSTWDKLIAVICVRIGCSYVRNEIKCAEHAHFDFSHKINYCNQLLKLQLSNKFIYNGLEKFVLQKNWKEVYCSTLTRLLIGTYRIVEVCWQDCDYNWVAMS